MAAIADSRDANNGLIGARGNIDTDRYMTLPGLTANRDKIYARTHTAFTG